MKERNYQEYDEAGVFNKPKDPPIVLSVEPRNGKEVKTLLKIGRKNPQVLILFYGGKKKE